MNNAHRGRGRPTKDASGKTIPELAAEAGVSVSTYRGWQDNKKLAGASLADRKKRAEIKRIDTEREKVALSMNVALMELLPRGMLEVALAEVAGIDDQFDAALISELPSRLAGLTASKIKKEIESLVDEWKEIRSDARSDAWKTVKAEVARQARGDLAKVAAKQK